jgi:hypothetical protein
MAISYSWTIRELSYEIGPDSEGHSDVVFSVGWLLTASDEADPPHEALWSGFANLTWEEGDDWIPYEDLTEVVVVGWVEEDIGEDELADMKLKLDAQIAEEVTPTHETSRTMPWDEDGG